MRYIEEIFCLDGQWLDIVWHGYRGTNWEPSHWDLYSVNGDLVDECDPDLWREVEENARRPA